MISRTIENHQKICELTFFKEVYYISKNSKNIQGEANLNYNFGYAYTNFSLTSSLQL